MQNTPENLKRYENFLIELYNALASNQKFYMSDLMTKTKVPQNTGKVLKNMGYITKKGGKSTVKYQWVSGSEPTKGLVEKLRQNGEIYNQNYRACKKAKALAQKSIVLGVEANNPEGQEQVQEEQHETITVVDKHQEQIQEEHQEKIQEEHQEKIQEKPRETITVVDKHQEQIQKGRKLVGKKVTEYYYA